MQARDLMTPHPSVVTHGQTVAQAAIVMRDRRVGMLPVIDDLSARHLVGVLTDRDIVVRGVAARHDPDRAVAELMTAGRLAVVHVDASPEEVEALMERRGLRRMPVLDARERVVGVIAHADLARLHARSAYLFSEPGSRFSDVGDAARA